MGVAVIHDADVRYPVVVVIDQRPGLDARRLIVLMNGAIERLNLVLGGRTVLTEAATGAYASTAVLAALAGARVFALAGATPYASAQEIEKATLGLARAAGAEDQIQLVYEKDKALLGAVDIVTNSGQVRPLDEALISCLKPTCVIPLMYEAWEYRSADIDLDACRAHGIAVAGTNERHPGIDVFSFLGMMAVRQLHEAGIAVYDCRILLLCDNDFEPFITGSLRRCGATVVVVSQLTEDIVAGRWDAVLLALKPVAGPVLTAADASLIARHAPGAVLVQYWGDADREALAAANVPVWPPQEPAAGHMAVLPSAIGPEAIIRLQAGGLKVGEILAHGLHRAAPGERALVQPL